MKTTSALTLLFLLISSPAILAFPFSDDGLRAGSLWHCDQPASGQRFGAPWPDVYAGGSSTGNAAEAFALPLGATEQVETGCMGDFNADGSADVAAVLKVSGGAATSRVMATFWGGPTGYTAGPRAAFSTVTTDDDPAELTPTDLDLDGDLDILYFVGGRNPKHEVAYFTNYARHTGRFDTATSILTPITQGGTAPALHAAAVLQVNLDEFPDLVLTDSVNNKVLCYVGSSAGTFTQATLFTLNQTDPHQLWTADLDRDGRKDIIIVNWLGGGRIGLSWHRNTGFGWGTASLLDDYTYPGSDPTAGLWYGGFTLSDVNDDGWQDMVYARVVTVYGGAGTWRYTNTLFYRPSIKGNAGAYSGAISMDYTNTNNGPGIVGLHGGDTDGDGDDDIVYSTTLGTGMYANTRIHGDSPAVSTDYSGSHPSGAVRLATADVDRDSWPDLIASSPGGKAILWYPGRPAGGFDAPVSLSTGTSVPSIVCTGDGDSDGTTDLFWSVPATGEIRKATNNNGTGTSWSQGTVATLPGLIHLSAGNLNHDADTDLLTVTSAGDVAWLYNNGTGTSWTTDALPDLPSAKQALGINLMQTVLDEVAITGTSPGAMQVRNSNIFANPKWQLVLNESGGTGTSCGLTSGDFNHDGYPDVAWCAGSGVIYWRTPSLSASQAEEIATLSQTVTQLRTMDWNDDGRDDILAVHSGGLTVFLSKSSVSPFSWAPVVLFTGNCSDAVPMDIDSDGRQDVAAFATGTGKIKLITHGPVEQVKVIDRAMTPDVPILAENSDSFFALKLTARSSGRLTSFNPDGTGGWLADATARRDRFRVRFLKALKSGSTWSTGAVLTQAELTATVDKVLVVRDNGTTPNALDVSDTVLLEVTPSINLGFQTLQLPAPTEDDDCGYYDTPNYFIALKMKPSLSETTSVPFFLVNSATDPGSGARLFTANQWPESSPVSTVATPTEGQIVNFALRTPYQIWRHSHFNTYVDGGNAASSADSDRDGMNNVAEYVLGTSPLTTDARQAISLSRTGNLWAILVDLPTTVRPDATVILQTGDGLGSWATLAQRTGTGAWTGTAPFSSPLSADTTRHNFLQPGSARNFYRLKFFITP